MKKYLLIILSICSLLCVQSSVYSEETSDIVVTEQQSMPEDNIQDSFQVPYQPEYKPAFLKMFVTLFALLILVFITFWMFKRLMKVRLHQANLTKSIKIIEKRALSPKSILYLIEIEGKKVVISESNLEVRKIKDID